MTRYVLCPHCRRNVDVTAYRAGDVIRCKHCKRWFTVGALE